MVCMAILDKDAYAKTYDMLYEQQTSDVEFYKRQARLTKGKILEVACGTGRVYLDLLKGGLDVYGIDYSRPMLDRLREKAKSLGMRPKVRLADMRSFNLGVKFSLIIIPFRAFLHNKAIDDQLATLRCLRRHMLPKSRLIMNFFLPDHEFMLKSFGKTLHQVLDVKSKTYRISKITRFVDIPNQLIHDTYVVRLGNKVINKCQYTLAFIYKREFELLLRLAGFKKWYVYGGFDLKPLKTSKQEMVWIIYR